MNLLWGWVLHMILVMLTGTSMAGMEIWFIMTSKPTMILERMTIPMASCEDIARLVYRAPQALQAIWYSTKIVGFYTSLTAVLVEFFGLIQMIQLLVQLISTMIIPEWKPCMNTVVSPAFLGVYSIAG